MLLISLIDVKNSFFARFVIPLYSSSSMARFEISSSMVLEVVTAFSICSFVSLNISFNACNRMLRFMAEDVDISMIRLFSLAMIDSASTSLECVMIDSRYVFRVSLIVDSPDICSSSLKKRVLVD